MNTRFRNVLNVLVASAVLGFSAAASAGIIDNAADKLQDKKSDRKSEQRQEQQPAQHRSGEPQRPPAPAQAQREEPSRGGAFGTAPPPRNNDNPRRDTPDAGRDRGPSRNLNDDLARLRGNDHTDNRGGAGGSRGGYRNPPPPRVVQRLPPGYRDYSWNGNRYYSSGGRWYRPYGGTYISIGVPFGLFVGTLPGLYTSFWYGDERYFYADNTYYTYEPVRRGYVVAHSPYGDDEESSSDSQNDDLYIYPARGQSEQQQADDRYQCHRWAAQESKYDPLDDDYNSDLRKDYQRAMTACLTGRGYTVN